ncbi:MAG TPA: right-handed parallel beta-helix repeat-containing protein [Armatimonadota bacterium]
MFLSADAGGIALETCGPSVITGNVIANTQSLQGVSVANSRGVTVSGNVITYPATSGVEVSNGHNVQVTNNQIIHAASDANRWGCASSASAMSRWSLGTCWSARPINSSITRVGSMPPGSVAAV